MARNSSETGASQPRRRRRVEPAAQSVAAADDAPIAVDGTDLREEWGAAARATTATVDIGSGRDLPPAPSVSRGTESSQPTHVRGTARGVDVRFGENQVQSLDFRVDRYDASGNRAEPVPVELRFYRGGQVRDGDEVEVDGDWKHGTLRASRIRNHTTGAYVRGGFPKWLKVGLLGFVGLLVMVLLIVVLASVVGNGGGAGAPPGFPDEVIGQQTPGLGDEGGDQRVEGVVVPDLVGLDMIAATSALGAAGLRPSPQFVDGPPPSGQVIATDPVAGTDVAERSSVTISISNGFGG